MTKTACALLVLSSSVALACWDAERVEWHSVSIILDHCHETPSWSVSRAKEWAAYAAAVKGPVTLATGFACGDGVCLEELPQVDEREVPIWTVQVFASRTREGAERALLAVEELVPPGFYTVELHPGPTRQGEVRERGKIFQAIAGAYATAEEAKSAVAVLRARGSSAWGRRE
jgi:hypothetical protein